MKDEKEIKSDELSRTKGELEMMVRERTIELEKANQRLQLELAERKRAEEALWLREQQLRLAVRASNTGLWDWNIQTGEIYFSPEWKAQIGYQETELENRFGIWEEHLHPDDRERMLKTVNSYLSNPWSNYEEEFRFRHKDGSYRWILARAALFTDEKGKPQRMLGSHVDITERKLTEEAMRQSEKKFSAIFQTIPDPIIIYRLKDGFMLDVNDAWSQFAGYSKSERLEKTTKELSLYVDPEARKWHEQTVSETGEVNNRYSRFRTKDGSLVHALVSARAIELDGEQCVVGIGRNVTDLKETEEALHLSEERYRMIVENQTEFIVKWMPDGTRTFVNESYCRYFGMTEEDCLGTSFLPLVAPEFHDAIHLKTASLTPDAPEYTEEHISIVPGGQCWQQWTNRGIFGDDGRLKELLSTGRDITERKHAEEELKQSREQLRALSARLQSVREEERTHIAREIHDELGQTLTGLKMDIASMARELNQKKLKPVAVLLEKTKSMSRLVDDTIKTVRRIATELRPGILDDLGLVAAIEWQANDFQNRTGIDCRLHCDMEEVDLDEARSTAVFRIFQETLTNVARHAEASAVNISIETNDDNLVLEVKDDGKGITEEEIAGLKSLGLLGMRERAALLGGKVEFSGSAGRGTRVVVRIPF